MFEKIFALNTERVVNEKGFSKTVNLDLSPREEKQLRHSANVLQDVFARLKL